MKPEVMHVIEDARQLLIKPESWINCFALSQDADGEDVWEVEDLEDVDRLSLCGALDLAAHRRKYPKSVSDAVVSFLYPLCWQHISAPYPFPHELIEDLAEGGNFMYEEFGYFNDQDGRTHAEVMEVLNTALAHGYAKTIPSLPTANDAVKRSFTELSAENKVSCQQQLSELIGDESQEFGKALVDHFPPEDGTPDFGDVQDFMCNWDDRYHDDEIVERALNIMQLSTTTKRTEQPNGTPPGVPQPHKETTTMQARIEKRDTDWIIITDDETYRVSSINNHCENKLQAMHNNGQPVHLQFEEIWEYHSYEYRAFVSQHADDKWHDDDVACLLEIHIDEAEIEAEAEKILAAATQPFVLFRKS